MAEQVAANPVEVEDAETRVVAEAQGDSLILRVIDGLWRLLRRPWLLAALLAVLGATLLWARTLPQIPGQLTESAADTTRWLNATLAGSSLPGAALARTLGLFDLYSSPWLRVILALVTLLAAVQLADAVGMLLAWRRLRRRALAGEAGEAIDVGMSGIARVRVALDTSLEITEQSVRAWAEAAHMEVEALKVQPAFAAEGAGQGTEMAVEMRLLMRRRGWSVWVAPLLAAGALIGALILWANLFWAWNLRPDVLAPGASFENARHGLAMPNQLFESEDSEAATLFTSGSRVNLPVDGRWQRLDPLGWARARANADTPALVISAEEPILSLPSAPKPQEKVGVLLPGLGSEQFVVLPGQGIGLRLVRISDGNEEQFWAEVYGEDSVQPIVRQQIEGPSLLEIPSNGETIKLEVAPARGLQVEVVRAFGGWLWLPALLMILAGLLALLLPARMLLAQLSPWEKERTLLIAQGTSAKDVEAVATATNP